MLTDKFYKKGIPQMTTQNKTALKQFTASNLEHATLAVARCGLNKLTDCTSKGLTVGVSHLGGVSRCSVITIHKSSPDGDYGVLVMNIKIKWDENEAIQQFKQAILKARKVISDHNKKIDRSTPIQVSGSLNVRSIELQEAI
jgi:hypothetical protein